LLARLPEILKHGGGQPFLTLRVPVGLDEQLKGRLSGYSLKLDTLPDGETGFAWVESATARVRIPLEEQLDALIHCLRIFNSEELKDGGC
jgi:hypothetical protein